VTEGGAPPKGPSTGRSRAKPAPKSTVKSDQTEQRPQRRTLDSHPRLETRPRASTVRTPRSSRLRRLLWRGRRLLSPAWSALVVAGTATLVALGWFPDLTRHEPVSALSIVAVSVLGLTLLSKLAARLRAPAQQGEEARWRSATSATEERRTAKADLELGAALVAALYVVLALSGGVRSPVYPLVYALTAFILTFHRKVIGVPLLGVMLGLEVLLAHGGPRAHTPADHTLMLEHLAFIGFFGVIHLLFLHGELMRQRREHKTRVDAQLDALRAEARDFRLISSSLSGDPKTRSRAADEERLVIGAVETIHLSLFYTLELLKRSLDLHTCVLFWLDESGERLKIKELVTDSDCITESPLPADAGALGTVVKNSVLLNLRDPKRSHLPYYSGPEEVASFMAVPVIEDGHLRGVLCADRLVTSLTPRPFSVSDESLLEGAAQQMVRALQSERVFGAVERAKYEHERFFGALAQLNRALGIEAVTATTFAATREICDYDFAALSIIDPATGKHSVIDAVGDVPRGLTGLAVDRAGLASMVVKNKHFLPAGGELRDKDAWVFSKKVRLGGMESLLVLPLICADNAMGAFTVAAKRPRAFSKDKRDMLTVIANHVAVSLANAQMYGRMEAMATTDGLTGLINHRTFQERFDEMLARAERVGGRHALLLTDIDHFKKVNDTHGHPVGDDVLRGVAHVVRDCVRKVDVAARYGGEEFAVVLEGTDLQGARETAERIRSEVEKQVFQSAEGPFSVTLSLGIACYGPDADSPDGRDKKTLISHADQALYHAKHNGRNKAVAFREITPGRLKAVK